MMSEKIELLGKGYKDIPSELTLKALPTVSELDYVSSEDFDQTMLDKIFPSAIEEKINFRNLLEIDYYWICRCLRFLNYGPYHTTNAIFCPNCGRVSGEYRVDLRSINCKPLPDNFNPDIVIPQEEFIDFEGDIHLRMMTVSDMLNSQKDKLFVLPSGETNKSFARLCYMVTKMGKEGNLSPINVKLKIENELSPADYRILANKAAEITDYGLRAGGSTKCPKCQETASYLALVDDRFLRPSVGDIKEGRNDRHTWGTKDIPTDASTTV